MPAPLAQRLSRTLYTTDGTTTVWDFAFSDGYLDEAHVKARVDTPGGLRTELVVTPSMLVGEFQLELTPALAAGDTLTIYRDTPKDAPLVNFTDEAGFSEIALDTNARQAVMVAAETADEVNTSDIGVASEAAIAASTSAAAALSSQTAAASSAVVANAAKVAAEAALDSFDDSYLGAKANDPALDNDGAALLVGALYWNTVANELRVYTGTVWLDTGGALANAPVGYTFDGTGAQTLFTLATTPASSKFVAVYVGGVFQEPSTYTLVGAALTFSEAPPAGTGNVDVTVFTPASFADAATVAYSPSGTGAVATTVQAKLRESVSVKDFGAVGDGVADDTAAIQAALNSGARHITAPGSGYKITAKLTVPGGVTLQGDGLNATAITIAANVVGVELSAYARLKGFKITKTGAHTANGIDCGSPTNGGGRMVVEDVWVDGVGNHGICVRNGNVGTIRDVICTSNGQDGINFNTETANTNAWKLDGTIDLRSNTRDGLHFDAGVSVSDPNAPRTISADLVISQQNGRYGAYIGTRNNKLTIYAEGNTTKDIYLDAYAYGNLVEAVEASNGFTDLGAANVISYHSADANYYRTFKGPVYFEGGANKGLRLGNDDGTAGSLSLTKTAARAYNLREIGSNADALTYVDHFNASYKHTLGATGGFVTSTATVSIPTATPTTVASFGVSTSDAFCGIIHVRDSGGSNVGSSALVSNFTSGGTQVLLLSGTANSTQAASSLTVSGGNVQFSHTFGSTRSFTITLVQFGRAKSL